MAENITGIVKHRNASNAALTAQNAVIYAGELVIETDTHQFKFGDGTTQYNSLEYAKVPELTTARLIQLSGDVSGSASFDGSANVTITATVADDSHNHVIGNIDDFTENVQDIIGAMFSGNTESGISVSYQDGDGTIDFNVNDPTITLSGDVSGSAVMTNLGNVTISVTVADDSHNHIISNVDGLQTALDGKLDSTATAAAATKLATARNITLTGDVSGSASFDGSANASITATVADNSHNHTTGNITGLNTAMLELIMPVGFVYIEWTIKDGSTVTGHLSPSSLWPGFGTWTLIGSEGGVIGFNGYSNDFASVWVRTA